MSLPLRVALYLRVSTARKEARRSPDISAVGHDDHTRPHHWRLVASLSPG